jgi:catechol 2,3-dioxygenase-like lactoylglutathione lyase family enzyme
MPLTIKGLCPLLQVFDMPTSLAFYRDRLGFEIVDRSRPADDADWVWLRHGPAELMLNTRYERQHRPPQPDPAAVAAHDDTCLYFGCPDVDAAYAELAARGLDLQPPTVAPYGMKQLYLHDPDGYDLCFQWRAD